MIIFDFMLSVGWADGIGLVFDFVYNWSRDK